MYAFKLSRDVLHFRGNKLIGYISFFMNTFHVQINPQSNYVFHLQPISNKLSFSILFYTATNEVSQVLDKVQRLTRYDPMCINFFPVNA